MPRSSRSSGSRPSARPAAPSAPSGTRQASTAAYPQQHAPTHAPGGSVAGQQTQQRQPGLLAQAASTAAGVGMGSVLGHGISNMLFGGSSHAQAPPPADIPAPEHMQQSTYNQQQAGGAQCAVEAKDFTKCMDATNDFPSCSYYLEALKTCQAAAARY